MLSRDALVEALRGIGPVVLGAAALVVLLAPALGGMALGARARTALDLALWLQWLTVFGCGLFLGAQLPGPAGLRAVVLAGSTSPGAWVATRTAGAWGALGAAVALLGGAGLLVGPLRAQGVGPLALHLAGLWAEGVVLVGLAGWLRALGARPWLAGVAAGGLAVAGHLEAEVVEALGTYGLEGLGRGLLLLLPGFDGVQVQGALIAGQPIDPAPVLAGFVQLLGWSLALGGATVLTMARRDLA